MTVAGFSSVYSFSCKQGLALYTAQWVAAGDIKTLNSRTVGGTLSLCSYTAALTSCSCWSPLSFELNKWNIIQTLDFSYSGHHFILSDWCVVPNTSSSLVDLDQQRVGGSVALVLQCWSLVLWTSDGTALMEKPYLRALVQYIKINELVKVSWVNLLCLWADVAPAYCLRIVAGIEWCGFGVKISSLVLVHLSLIWQDKILQNENVTNI